MKQGFHLGNGGRGALVPADSDYLCLIELADRRQAEFRVVNMTSPAAGRWPTHYASAPFQLHPPKPGGGGGAGGNPGIGGGRCGFSANAFWNHCIWSFFP